MRLTRRTALLAAASATVAPLLALVRAEAGAPQVRVTGFDLLPIRATSRTVWLIAGADAHRGDGRGRGLQYGEVGWRSDSVVPAERFINGTIQVPERPGFGIDLNEASFGPGHCLSDPTSLNTPKIPFRR